MKDVESDMQAMKAVQAKAMAEQMAADEESLTRLAETKAKVPPCATLTVCTFSMMLTFRLVPRLFDAVSQVH